MRRLTAKELTVAALLTALCLVLSLVESTLPPLPVPGARLGLSNVAVTASAVLVSPLCGVLTAVLKVLFVFLTRGASSAWMAGWGTALSVTAMLCVLPLQKRQWMSFVGVCITSAGMHTAGQLFAAALMLSPAVWSYAPLLLVLSVPAGFLTGLVLNLLIPRLMPLMKRTLKE